MNGYPEGAGPADHPIATEPPSILVLALGNMLLSDDGAGPALLEQLAASPSRWPAGVEFIDGGTQGLALLGQLAGRRAVIIVDALQTGAPPGTVHRLTLNELHEITPRRLLAQTSRNSGHESNAAELIAAAELLGELPDRLFVVGIEAQSIHTGLGLTPPVRDALPAALDQVASLLSQLS
ncbi:MAG TPA: hydrogenase maturation protease [Candidatus Eremiobacteraceae bacterium]|nr:hydrogenase maturation protease [Candidatus Eremiobacteraceae bacterium]